MEQVNFKRLLIKRTSVAVVLQILDKITAVFGLIVLVRLLKPADFGIAFLTQTFVGFFSMLKFGMFDSALIYERRDEDEIYEIGFSADLSSAFLIFSTIFFLAPLWANFYNYEVLKDTVRFYGIVVIVESFALVPKVRLMKEFRFVELNAISLFTTCARVGSFIIFAAAGFSFWSIIYGSVIAVFLLVFLLNIAHRQRIRLRFDLNILKRLINYGKYILSINIVGFVLSEIGGVAIGKILGIVAAGLFAVAYRWGFWVFTNVFTFIEYILFPVYSRYQQDEAMAKRIFTKTMRYGSAIAFPISIGLFMVAPEFTNIVLGPKWAPIIAPLRILCFAGLIQFLGCLTNPFLKGLGYVKAESKRIYLNIALLLAFLFPLLQLYGITGASIAVFLSSMITQSIFYVYATNILKIRRPEIAKSIYSPLIAASFMALSILLAKNFIFNMVIKSIGEFIILIIVGSVAYFSIATLFMKREIASEIISLKMSRQFR